MDLHKVLLLSVICTCIAAFDTLAEVAGTQPPAVQILIRNVSVWDGTSDRTSPGQDVLIEDNLIHSIGTNLPANADALTVDGGGRVLMPGIIDAHAHIASPIPAADAPKQDPAYVAALSLKIARMLLMRGWTTMRDVGGPSQGIARAIDEGHADGPRIYPSAMYISQTSGHGDFRERTDPHPNMGGVPNAFEARYTLLADGPAEVRRAVRESLRQGATQIKVMAGGGISSEYDPLDTVQFSVEELRAAVDAAADWHTYVTVHAYTDEAVNRALDAGVKVIEHGHLLTEPTLKRIKSDGAYLSSQSFGFVRNYPLTTETERGRKAKSVMDGVDNLMNTARKIGLPVAFGTDSFGAERVYVGAVKEFSYRLRWFDSLEILKQATSHNAKLLELTGPRNPYKDGPLGVIQPGAYADLLIVDGDPLDDVTVLEDYEANLRLIMKDGNIYKNTL
ncbi:MAG: amidohydrolase family protein [Gammaproteobacteria bacterium]